MPRLVRWGERIRHEWNELKPVLSIVIIISTLLGLVFLQMEERRIGYTILKMSRNLKNRIDERRALELRLAQATRLEKLEVMASQRLTLKKAQSHQVIYLNDSSNKPISALGKPIDHLSRRVSPPSNLEARTVAASGEPN